MKDLNGNPDFKSAWDSVIEDVGIDNQSLKSFIQIVQNNDDINAVGMQDRSKTYNAFLILAGKVGSLRWAIFKLASSLQVLNSALSLSVGANITEIIPNLHVGVLSKALMFQIKSPFTTLKAQRIIEMLSTMSSLTKTPSNELQYYMSKDNHVTASDPIGKMFTVWYREDKRQSILRQIMRELLGSHIQFRFGKQTEEKVAAYNQYMDLLFNVDQYKAKLNGFEPEVLHWLEDGTLTAEKISSLTFNEQIGEEEFDTGTGNEQLSNAFNDLQSVLRNNSKLEQAIREEPIFKQFEQECLRFYAISQIDISQIKNSDSDELEMLTIPESLDEIYPDAVNHFLEFLFLRKRSMRYHSVVVDENSELKKRSPFTLYRPVLKTEQEVGSLESLLFSFLKSRCAKIIAQKEQDRATEFKNKQIMQFFKFLKNPESALSIENVRKFLKQLCIVFGGKKYILNRIDLCIDPDFYAICQKLNKIEILKEFLIGDWATEQPQCLKKFIPVIEHMIRSYFLKDDHSNSEKPEKEQDNDGFAIIGESAENRYDFNINILKDIKEAIGSKMVCKRTSGYNRHGHSAQNPFPGSAGWSEQYEAALRKGCSVEGTQKKRELMNMKRFTTLYQELMQKICGKNDRLFIESLIQIYTDPNCFHIFQHSVFTLLYDDLMLFKDDQTLKEIPKIAKSTKKFWSAINPQLLCSNNGCKGIGILTIGRGKIKGLIITIYGKGKIDELEETL